MNIRNVSSSTATVDYNDSMIKCNCASFAIAVTLRPASKSQQVTVKKVDTTANAVTIYPASGETIDGAASVTLAAQNDKKTLQPIAGGWTVIDSTDDVGTSIVTLTGTQTLTNKRLTSPKINEDAAVTATATEINLLDGATVTTAQINKLGTVTRLYNLGAPGLADDDLIVTTTNMKVGTYTIAAQPDVPRNITVSVTAVGTADTMGTIDFVGTNIDDEAITETITPIAGSTVAGVKAFKSVTSATGVGWVIDGVEGTEDTITIGTGNEIGMPLVLDAATEMVFGILDTTITAHNPTVGNPATIEETTIDMSAGTYNGSKVALIFVVD